MKNKKSWLDSPLMIVITRELTQRVRTKAFLLSTFLMPLFMVAMMVVPAMVMNMSSVDQRRVAVVDKSGTIFAALEDTEEVAFLDAGGAAPVKELSQDTDSFTGVLIIPASVVQNPQEGAVYQFHGAGSAVVEKTISRQLRQAVRIQRLNQTGIPGIQDIIARADVSVPLATRDLDREGAETDTAMSVIVGMALSFILYMFIIMYGQMVMGSVIEEKTNRVLEVMVSSVRPSQMMLGKIMALGMVAALQIVIWAIVVCTVAMAWMPSMLSSATGMDADTLSALWQLADGWYLAGMFGWLLLFLIGGYLLYAGLFAAIGSAVDNIQDASQMQMLVMLPIIIALVVSMSIARDPDSTMAVLFSLIPFTSPMLMLSRIPFGVPAWQMAVSLGLLFATVALTIWVSAKIYRVGIFMYGKKPTPSQLWRWFREK